MISKNMNTPTIETSSASSSQQLVHGVQHLGLVTSAQQVTTAGTRSTFLFVPRGAVKMFISGDLKSLGAATSMFLFPNFPPELRHRIYREAVEEQENGSVSITVTDTGSKFAGVSIPRPALLSTSRDALAYFLRSKYAVIFRFGVTLFDPRVQTVSLNLVSEFTRPHAPLIQSMLSPMAFTGITSLTVEVLNVRNGIPWAIYSTVGLNKLKIFRINVKNKITDDRQLPVTFEVDSRDMEGDREEYVHFLNVGEKTAIEGRALQMLHDLLADQNEVQDVLSMFGRLDLALRNKECHPNFPSKVVTSLEWAY